MLVSHSKKFIYIKVPKSAGTSVEKFFEKECLPPGGYDPEKEDTEEIVSEYGIVGFRGKGPKTMDWYNHLSAERIKEKLGDEIWNSYYKFAVVRNPFDRLISFFWFNIKQKKGIDIREAPLNQIKEVFDDWIQYEGNWLNLDFIRINGDLAVDFCIRFESLEEDVIKVARRLDIDIAGRKLGTYKKGFRNNEIKYSDLIKDSLKVTLCQYYRWEMDKFGYNFD